MAKRASIFQSVNEEGYDDVTLGSFDWTAWIDQESRIRYPYQTPFLPQANLTDTLTDSILAIQHRQCLVYPERRVLDLRCKSSDTFTIRAGLFSSRI